MKKSLVALAALAVAGVASAQSSVTLFGIVDAAVGHQSTSGGASATGLVNSGYNSSRLGFRGVEDLGGGLSASFWLEAGINNDNGSFGTTNTNGTAASGSGGGGLTFNRRSTVSLSGGFGEIRIGRDFTPTFWNDTVFDPFGTNGVGTNLFSTAAGATHTAAGYSTYVRSSNTVGYFLPSNIGGFYGQVQYGFDEQTAPAAGSVGQYKGLRFGYQAGPVNVALAWGETSGVAGGIGDTQTVNLGASYDLGVAKIMGEWGRVDVDSGTLGLGSVDLDGWLLGVSVPVGAGEIRAAYSKVSDSGVLTADGSANKIALGYVHNLSKRTALYATYARISNKNGLGFAVGGLAGGLANANSKGYEFGVRHSF
ncbi:porin [Variovorax sp. VNK109]|uniref:porin n=1 Tax=Variovorax sp. VNK109 TaxID=3400919 RepID=UPI003C099498